MINRLESKLQRMETFIRGLGLNPSILEHKQASPSVDGGDLSSHNTHSTSFAETTEGTHRSRSPTIFGSAVTNSPEIESSLLDSLASYFVPHYFAHKPAVVGKSVIISLG